MILFPKDKPMIRNLNSFYVDIHKLFEHYRGETTSGAVHFKAPSMEGVVFFDENEPLRGMVRTQEGSFQGAKAVEHMLAGASKFNCTLSVFEIPPEKLFFWTHLHDAQPIYDKLDAEFTDLAGLVKKMNAEKLTGVIEVSKGEKTPMGIILFENGEVIDVTSSLIDPEISEVDMRLKTLIAAGRDAGITFSVRRIPVKSRPAAPVESESTLETDRDFTMQAELIDIFDRALSAKRKDFHSLFRKRCIANAERFDFLDPFVGEFEYADGRISFTGDTREDVLTRGLLATLTEIAEEENISDQIQYALNRWKERWQERLD